VEVRVGGVILVGLGSKVPGTLEVGVDLEVEITVGKETVFDIWYLILLVSKDRLPG